MSRVRFRYNFVHEKLVQDEYFAENMIEIKNSLQTGLFLNNVSFYRQILLRFSERIALNDE